MAWPSFHADSGRTVIIGTTSSLDNVLQQAGHKGFMIFWHAELVGLIVRRQQGIEKSVEFTFAYEADVADLHGPIRIPWGRVPQCMTERRILDCKLFAKDVVVSHLWPQVLSMPECGWRGVG